MMSGFGWAALALHSGYLALFFWDSAVAARAAGKPVWLFAQATGRDRLAAFGFRAAFSLAFFGPLLWGTAIFLTFRCRNSVRPFEVGTGLLTGGLVGGFVSAVRPSGRDPRRFAA